MKKVRIIGVPEHFNLPWKMCIENGEFDESGINLEWTDIPEGTGKMCEMLRKNETDLAIILTEGICKDISKGNPTVIIQEYVSSPLQWGIFVSSTSEYTNIEQLEGKKVAISRYGSGSQLMAIVNAQNNHWSIDNLKFEVVNTLEGAIESLTNKETDYFMWDRFMTQPIVDKGIFRRIGICPTPWPSFILVATKSFAEENQGVIKNICEIINTTTREFKFIPSIDKTVSEIFGQKLENVQEWLEVTNWSQKKITKEKFDIINKKLVELNIIDQKLHYEEVVL